MNHQLKQIILQDIYLKYCEILKQISVKYKIDYQTLHDMYLSKFIQI